MAKRKSRAANTNNHPETQHHSNQHIEDFNRQPSKSLRIRLDDLITIEPLTDNQKKFFDHYKNGETFIVLHGCPGTGKSFLSCYKAIEEVLNRSSIYEKLIIVRSSVPSREVGFLPGSLEEKTDILTQPYNQIFSNLFQRGDAYQRLVEQKHLEFISSSYLRGMTFDNSIIFVDEIQNVTWQEISTVCGRIGINSKIIFAGDFFQNDLVRKQNDQSGLPKFMEVIEKMNSAVKIDFSVNDIVRSGLVKEWILACLETKNY